jgi:YesN/AraC family two-component response regulator
MSPMIKLLIIDDSSILRERLITLISEIKGINVVGEAETVRDINQPL